MGKLCEADIELLQGGTTAEACRRIGVTEQAYYGWRREDGGLKGDQARRMKTKEFSTASRLGLTVSEMPLPPITDFVFAHDFISFPKAADRLTGPYSQAEKFHFVQKRQISGFPRSEIRLKANVFGARHRFEKLGKDLRD